MQLTVRFLRKEVDLFPSPIDPIISHRPCGNENISPETCLKAYPIAWNWKLFITFALHLYHYRAPNKKFSQLDPSLIELGKVYEILT